MADYIYMMESRLTPEQQKAVAVIAEAARIHEMNIFLTGGTVRDVVVGVREAERREHGRRVECLDRGLQTGRTGDGLMELVVMLDMLAVMIGCATAGSRGPVSREGLPTRS